MTFPSSTKQDERGSTVPLVVGTIFVLILFLSAALAITAIARERVRQQATADMAALSGANAIAKSIETARVAIPPNVPLSFQLCPQNGWFPG